MEDFLKGFIVNGFAGIKIIVCISGNLDVRNISRAFDSVERISIGCTFDEQALAGQKVLKPYALTVFGIEFFGTVLGTISISNRALLSAVPYIFFVIKKLVAIIIIVNIIPAVI